MKSFICARIMIFLCKSKIWGEQKTLDTQVGDYYISGVGNQFCPSLQLNISRNMSSKTGNPALKKMMEQGKGMSTRLKKWGSGDGNITDEDLEPLPNLDEEVIGIIAIKDVMEELLQVKFLSIKSAQT